MGTKRETGHKVKLFTFHGGDEVFLSVAVGGQNFVEPLQFGISAVVLWV